MENSLRKKLEIIKARARARSPSCKNSPDADDLMFVDPQSPSGQQSAHELPPSPGNVPQTLVDVAPGEACHLDSHSCYLIRTEGDAIAHDATIAVRSLRGMTRRTLWPLTSLIEEPGPDLARQIRDEEVCFFDIETTGLVPNTYLFLCGFMYLRGDHFVIDQVLARDYAEEVGVLLYTRDMLQRFPRLITYNGASFDMPFVRTRMAVARVDPVDSFAHVDLYEPAKKKFKGMFEDCKLATIERHLRGLDRQGDIPGSEIPGAYHEFVRSGDARRIGRILYHNRMDLLAMAFLLGDLAQRC